MSRVVVTDQAFGGVEREAETARRLGAQFDSYQCTTEAETAEAVSGADVVLVNFAPITSKVLAAMSAGGTVIRYGIGYDNVDVAAARELGIAVSNVPDYGSDTVADHTVACLLALLRKLPAYTGALRARGWCAPSDLGPLPGFGSTTVGLVGTGRIGLAVNRRLQAFGFRVLAHDPYADRAALQAEGVVPAKLDEVLETSHAISLHAPLTPETRHVIDGVALGQVRRGAVLVNTSRGGLVDEAALVEALLSGQVAGAALDVFDPEPLSPESPLRGMDQVILTPHAAFFSDDSLAALQRLASDEAARALEGKPLRCPVT